jgi:hypothetical protein
MRVQQGDRFWLGYLDLLDEHGSSSSHAAILLKSHGQQISIRNDCRVNSSNAFQVQKIIVKVMVVKVVYTLGVGQWSS